MEQQGTENIKAFFMSRIPQITEETQLFESLEYIALYTLALEEQIEVHHNEKRIFNELARGQFSEKQ